MVQLKQTGHVSSLELQRFYEWLLTPSEEREPASLNWTSGFARQLAYVIENYYTQTTKPTFQKYKDTFSTHPYMCHTCRDPGWLEKQRNRLNESFKSSYLEEPDGSGGEDSREVARGAQTGAPTI